MSDVLSSGSHDPPKHLSDVLNVIRSNLKQQEQQQQQTSKRFESLATVATSSTQQWRDARRNTLKSVESRLDPIDLAFYEPHLRVVVQRCYQRSSLLFGAFTRLSPLYTQTTTSTTSLLSNVIELFLLILYFR